MVCGLNAILPRSNMCRAKRSNHDLTGMNTYRLTRRLNWKVNQLRCLVRMHRRVVIATFLLSVSASIVYIHTITPVYSATATVKLGATLCQKCGGVVRGCGMPYDPDKPMCNCGLM